ncbi:MAG: iron-containing alcohol dehydrogenase [Thermoguttaceae bacterium]|jgi:NADP-dependent alcohol dehydrogenase
MDNFDYRNPVRIVFGKGQIAKLAELLPSNVKILLTYGGGSIFKNGVYDQVKSALGDREVIEFGGIEPNPEYTTCMKAVALAKEKKIDFILSVGGGSTLDGSKFIAAAIKYPEGEDPWDILEKGAPINDAVPLASVITLPATGSEMNGYAVVSRREKDQKLCLWSDKVFCRFSIIDPETTYSLPAEQISNGIVDIFVHIIEQYATHPMGAITQDRQAEALMLALIDTARWLKKDPQNYDARANLCWLATLAENGWISVGTAQCWMVHMIGHELTARTGTDHAKTLALVLPAAYRHQRREKEEKLLQYAERVWGITGDNKDKIIDEAILKTVNFFTEVGITPSRNAYGVTDEVIRAVAAAVDARGVKFGDRVNIGGKEIIEILNDTAE